MPPKYCSIVLVGGPSAGKVAHVMVPPLPVVLVPIAVKEEASLFNPDIPFDPFVNFLKVEYYDLIRYHNGGCCYEHRDAIPSNKMPWPYCELLYGKGR